MQLGIMQPYFFPNLAHFALIAATDSWVVFDVTQYTRKSWMNRNRILHPTRGWHYVSVPLEQTSLETKIYEARVADMAGVRKSLHGKISHYKKSAPHYDSVLQLINRVFDGAADNSLVSLNVSCLTEVCSLLDIPFSFQICSQMNLNFPQAMAPGDWAPFICEHLKASSYVNPAGGRALFDPKQFEALGVDLRFAEFSDLSYPTPGYDFEPGLSILDALMWVDVDQVRSALTANIKLLPG